MKLDIRAAVHRARETRLLGRPVRLIDRMFWARVILKAGVVDADYVSAQLGRRIGVVGATLLYVGRGFRRGLRLNPLFVDTAVGDHLPQAHRVPALYAYLIADPRGLEISPIWSAASYLERHPERADGGGGALGAVWRRRHTDSIPLGAEATTPGPDWDAVRQTACDAAASARADTAARVDGAARTFTPEVEYIVLLEADEWDFDESLSLAAQLAEQPDAGVTVVQVGGRVEDWVQTALLATVSPRVRAVRVPGGHRSVDPITVLEDVDAPIIVWRGPNDDVSADTLRDLALTAAEGAVVGPLWLDADGTIASAGAGHQGRLLAAHPAEDASRLPGAPKARVPALAGSTFAATRDLALLPAGAGADRAARVSIEANRSGTPIVLRTDLPARARAGAPTAHLPSGLPDGASLVVDAGWEPTGDGPVPRLRRPQRQHALDDGTVVPVLRWALRTAAPVGPRGEWWGDVHFARALRDALRRLGQDVVIDAYPARNRATRHLDDVTIALRGPEPIDPSPYGTSILWIISHPEQLTAETVEAFDLVYAASVPWAARASRVWNRPIAPLLQCTDAVRFRPSGIVRGTDIIFVGTARGIYRPSVVEPVRAGVPVKVFGPDWREWIPASAIAGTGVRNADLPPLYESAAVVLNDHWPSMQRAGFIANRPYDVVAAGGRVISDEVEGIDEVFQGAVITYRDTDELLRLVSSDLDAHFPDPGKLAEIARTIRRRDSFDARARTLLDDVTRHRT